MVRWLVERLAGWLAGSWWGGFLVDSRAVRLANSGPDLLACSSAANGETAEYVPTLALTSCWLVEARKGRTDGCLHASRRDLLKRRQKGVCVFQHKIT